MRSNACQERCWAGSGKFLGCHGRGVGNERECLDFVRWAKAAMIEIGQCELGADLIGRIVGVRFPVGLGGR